MLYPQIAEMIERELGVKPLGYVPEIRDFSLESRHLGLVLPGEIAGIQEKLDELAAKLEESLDLDALISLCDSAPDFEAEEPENRKRAVGAARDLIKNSGCPGREPVIAVAKDEAFCFLYEDNLELLRDMGARLTFFSPIRDRSLPECDGLILCGGYPELHLEELSGNEQMRAAVYAAVAKEDLPTLAECGGFMYLQQEMEDMKGNSRPVAGVFPGRAFRTNRLGRFGYIELSRASSPETDGSEIEERGIPGGEMLFPEETGSLKGHEFHYFDTTDNGSAFVASKPLRSRTWNCMHMTRTMAAGFPHLFYNSNPDAAFFFFRACLQHRMARGSG